VGGPDAGTFLGLTAIVVEVNVVGHRRSRTVLPSLETTTKTKPLVISARQNAAPGRQHERSPGRLNCG